MAWPDRIPISTWRSNGRPLGLDLLGRIAEALSESDLPYRVDIVDLTTADPAFRVRIAADCIPLPIGRDAE